MKKEMLINVLQPEECRIAILEDGVLEELYVERTSHETYTGNIYKGRVVNLEPAIQASFVDFSVGRNGFLHVSDVEPQYYRRYLREEDQLGGRDRGREPWRERGEEGRGSRSETRRGVEEPRESRGTRGDEPRRSSPRTSRDEVRPVSGEEPPYPYPPQLEDHSRPRPPRSGDEGPERPDRSEKGRRDRSERRFGEGLFEAWDEPEPAEPPAILPEPPEVSPGTFETPATQVENPSVAPIESPSGRLGGGHVPRSEGAEPRAASWSMAPVPSESERVEADLPPSRTHRGRGPAGFETEPGTGGRPLGPTGAERLGPTPTEASPPRSPRGRGRGSRPAGPTSEPPRSHKSASQAEGDEGLTSRRARSGRAAIRARGLEPSSGPEVPTPPITPDSEQPPETRASGPRLPETGRTPRSHGRAGEPGYIPRRERQLAYSEFDPEAPSPPTPVAWPAAGDEDALEPDAMYDSEAETRIFGESEAADGTAGGKRRRRKRRRRGPSIGRAGFEESTTESSSMDEDLEDFDETAPPPGPREPRSRWSATRRSAEASEDDPFSILDEESAADFEEGEESDASVTVTEPHREEEIDPELEEEIRREIEEITAMEREMGLRGPEEARPARGTGRQLEEEFEEEDRPKLDRRGGRIASKPPIQEIFRRGDEVLVQVIKEAIGNKGPTLSTYISIPGRYLVLMPGLNRVGVSRKIADETQRRKLREIMNELNPPKGLGFIVRTAGLDRTKRELARDLAYLLRLWKVILRRIKKTRAPGNIYQESDMITRTIRDIFTSEIDTIWIDERQAFERAQEFLRVVMPKFVDRVKYYDEKVPLFHKYGLEEEIAKIQRRRVDLPAGGSIVIDQTEALVAIDVNSGNFRVEDDAERTAYEMNLRAAKEIARQLRLRDLGGVIVNDFIDMRDERHRRGVERALREAVKRDRARTKILRMSQFGLIEMTRQRIRPSLKRSVYEDCTYCAGAGVVKTPESVSIDVMRLLALAAHREDIRRVNVSVHAAVAAYLNNRKRHELATLEADATMIIHIRHEQDVPAEHLRIECFDDHNHEVRLLPQSIPAERPQAPRGQRGVR
jgi:ribonuclease E